MAGRIPQAVIDEILARTDLVGLINNVVKLKKAGKDYSACCPFHQEKSPSFTVSPKKQLYHCFGCGEGGNAISFLMTYDHLSFIEALKLLADKAGVTLPTSQTQSQQHPNTSKLKAILTQACQFYQHQLKKHPEAIAYLKNRGITGEMAKLFKLGYAPPGWDNLKQHFPNSADQQNLLTTGMLVSKTTGGSYDRYRGRIIFPIRDRKGDIIGFGGRVLNPDEEPKYLNSPESPLFHKSQALYGLHELLTHQRQIPFVLVVEGYLDVITLTQYGIPWTVATLGTATTRSHLQQLSRLSPKIICCFDGDNAGRSAAWRALAHTLPLLQDGLDVKFMFLPDGQDPDSFCRAEGKSGFIAQVHQAQGLADFLLDYLSADIDLASSTGRAHLVEQAMPLMNQIPSATYQRFLHDQLARYVRMDPERLPGLAQEKSRQQPTGQTLSPIEHALSILLQHPDFIKNIAKPEKPSIFVDEDHEIFYKLLDLIQNQPNLTAASLLENWRDTEQFQQLVALANRELQLPMDGIDAEWRGILNQLEQQATRYGVECLLQKANTTGLTPSERQQLQTMIVNSKSRETV